MNFSIIFPTRERIQLLKNLLSSIESKTKYLNKIEVLIGYDNDDIETHLYLNKINKEWIKPYARTRGNSISVDYQNWLFGFSSGKFLFVLNDDVELLTDNWDEICLNKAKEDILYGWTSDCPNSKSPYSCFPIISRKAVKALGYLMPPYYSGWSADIYLHKVFSGVQSICDMREIIAYHKSHWIGNREKDKTSESMRIKSMGTETLVIDPNPDISKLKKAKGPYFI